MGLTLDAGCGSNPIPRADVTCDLYFGAEDQGGPVEVNGKFLICDVQYLPFRTKVFSHVNCTHVLEHIPHPQKGYAELRRVSKHGYVETPSIIYENLLFGWPGHLWVFSKRRGRIVFKPVQKLTVKNFSLLPLGWLTQRLSLHLRFAKYVPTIRSFPMFYMSHRW